MGHAYVSPLRRWEVLAGLCQEANAKTFVEVGCKDGRTTGFLLNALPDLHVIAIDPWAPMPNDVETYKDWDFKAIEAEFWKNVGEHKSRCSMLRETSKEAAHKWLYPETHLADQVDVVFIDAGHDYKSCKEDIELWWPLVRDGGYLCFHDYQHKFPGVMRAIADSFCLMDVAIFPDSVGCVEKRAGARKAA